MKNELLHVINKGYGLVVSKIEGYYVISLFLNENKESFENDSGHLIMVKPEDTEKVY